MMRVSGRSQQSCSAEQLPELDPAESSTKASTDIDTDSTSSVGAEVDDKAINLCDVLKEFMKQREERKEEDESEDERLPDAIPDTRNLKAIEERECKQTVRTTLKSAVASGRLAQALQEVIAEANQERENEEAEKARLTAWRTSLRDTLATAAADGRLASVLGAVKEMEVPKQAPSLEDLRSKVRQTFEDAAQNGKLDKELNDARRSAQAEVFRTQARNVLLNAFQNGTLKDVLTQVGNENQEEQRQQQKAEALRAQARGTVLQALTQGKLQDVIAQVKSERDMQEAPSGAALETLRSKMRNIFRTAAFDGRLESAMAECTQQSKEPAPSQKAVHDLRMKLREDLQTAALNGKLSEALQETKRHIEVEQARDQARDTLLKGLKTGSLARALQAVQEEEEEEEESPTEALRLKVRSTFAAAAQNGNLASMLGKKDSLSESLPQATSDDAAEAATERMRLMMRATLSDAVLSGRLEDAVGQVKRSQQERPLDVAPERGSWQWRENLRMQLRNCMIAGAEDGTLQQAMTEAKTENLRTKARDVLRNAFLAGSLQKAVEETKKESLTPPKASPLDELRKNVSMSFAKAAEDGSLTTAIKKTKQAMALEELRTKAKSVLINTAMNGNLKEALEEAVQQKSVDDLRLQAREALSKSVLTGQLQTILKEELAAEERQDTVASVRNALVAAARNGELSEAVKAVKVEQEAKTKKAAAERLFQAASNGKLSAALEATAAKERSDSLASRLLSGFQKGVQDGSLTSTLKEAWSPQPTLEEKLKNGFSRALTGGHLKSALKESMTESIEELRQNAQKCFAEAEQSGQLAAVMKQVLAPEQQVARPQEVAKYPPAPVPAPDAVAHPSKPTSAKGNSRPSRHFPRAAAVPSAIEVEDTEEPQVPTSLREQRPSSCKSSRTRIIIGGVERAAATADHDADLGFPTTPTLGRRSMVSAFRMDVEEASMMMDGDDEAVDTHPWENPETAPNRVAPGSKMHSSSGRASTPKKPMMSAMAMDLNEEAPLPSSKSTLTARSPRASHSLGAVRPKIDMQAYANYAKLPPVFKPHKSSCPPANLKRTRTPVSRKLGTEKTTWTVQLGEKAVQWDISHAVC